MLDEQGNLQIAVNVSTPQLHELGIKCHWEKNTLHSPLAYKSGWRLSKAPMGGSCVKWLITSRKRKENPEAKLDSCEDVFCNDCCIFLRALPPLYSFPLPRNQFTSRSRSSALSCYLVQNDTWMSWSPRHSTSGGRAGLSRVVFLTVLSAPAQDERSQKYCFTALRSGLGTGKGKWKTLASLWKTPIGNLK